MSYFNLYLASLSLDVLVIYFWLCKKLLDLILGYFTFTGCGY